MAVRKAIKEEKEEKPFNINDLIKDVADSVNDRLRTADNKLIVGGDSEEMSVPYWVRTGIPQLDYAVGGIIHPGFPGARIIEIFGGEGCLSGDTTVRVSYGKKSSKSMTLKDLYHRFKKIPTGDGRKDNRFMNYNGVYTISSINEADERVIHQPIADVVQTGVKMTYKVRTSSGKELICTEDHKFYIGNKEFKPLKDLNVGDIVYIHDKVPKKGRKPREYKPYTCVKYHPTAMKRNTKVGGKTYAYYSRDNAVLTYEAHLNNMSFDEFVHVLNTETKEYIDTLKFIDSRKQQVHHKDGNHRNNSLDNMRLLTCSEHSKLHIKDRIKNLSFIAVTDTIESIEEHKEIMTYDVKCFAPNNNYIANDIVVHNSGKSTLTTWLTKCAINQLDTFAVYQDAERVLTDEIIRGTGINMERVILQHPDVLEEVFESQEAIIEKLEEQKTKRPVVMVLDSVAACSTKSEIDGDYGDSTMGIHARIMSQAMRKIKSPIFTNNVFSIFVNQIRDKMNVTYGKNTTTSGGKSLPFYASVRIELAKIGAIKDSSKNATGVTIQATIVKNKVAPPLKKVTFDVLFAQDSNSSYPQIDIWGSTLDWLKDNELIGGTTGRYEVDGRSMYKNQARTLLQENPELFQQLVDMAYSVGKEKQE